MSSGNNWNNLNPYDRHKMFINQYVLTKRGTTCHLSRDPSTDKRDIDVIRENHQFLWDENDPLDTWEKRVAKKYYDKLFKEYCMGDLNGYKTNRVGFRWRTEKEVIDGTGQFSCGEIHCGIRDEELKTWEVNFGYVENGIKKNALIKIRLCPKCSKKLNYSFKRKEVKRLIVPQEHKVQPEIQPSSSSTADDRSSPAKELPDSTTSWRKELPSEKSEDQEVDEFLRDLFL